MRRVGCTGLLVVASGVAVAVESPSTGTIAGPGPEPLGGALLQTFGGLLLIVLLIFLLGWLVRRYGKLPIAGKGEINVVGGVSLGPRERAVLLQVGDTRLLVGVAPGWVQTLHVLGDGGREPQRGDGGFDRRLATALGGEAS